MARYKFDQIAFNSTDKKKPTEEDKTHYIGLEHLDAGSLQVTRWGSEVAPKGEKLLMKKGDVLFGKRRAYQKKVAIAPFDGIFSAHGMVLRPKTDVIDPDFFPLFIASDYFLDAAIKISVGSLSPTINWRDLRELEFELPSIDMQKKLAKVLWALIETKESYTDLIQKTDELVKSQFIEMFGDPVRNSKNWPTKPLSSVAPEYAPTVPMEDTYWWLNLDMIETFSGRLLDRVTASTEEIGNSTSTFDDSMVLYSKLRPYLNKVYIPDGYGYATTELVGLKPNPAELNKYFLFNLLRGDQFVAYATGLSSGGQMPRIPMKALREFKCILPPMELQNQFVDTYKQSDKSKFELQYVNRNVKEMITCSQKKIRLNR
jgi:type I restriction enzyme S subunit